MDATRDPSARLPGLRVLHGDAADYDALVDRARDATYVLLGEASHGTDEFYRERAAITRRLIAEAGYTAVAVEADWPDAYRVNRYVRDRGADASAAEALSGFTRFPTWMWRNTVVEEFVTWLRDRNAEREPRAKAGFYGLDLYSLHTSMAAVVAHLDDVDPAAAERARERYGCFDHFGPDPQAYAYEAGVAGAEPCEAMAVEQLVELRDRAAGHAARTADIAEDGHFPAEMNARLVVNAERYYREMFRGGIRSWNLRDTHMAEMLAELVAHLERTCGPTKVVVWAHNSHLGDARATELGDAGELNLGQLVRERAGNAALLVGFSTYAGTVTAASDWGRPAQRKRVRAALPGSWEERFHETGVHRFLIAPRACHGGRLERAIGVIYRPETERASHYFHARIADQFDALIHIDRTSALEPLEATSEWEAGELPETYPFTV